jgi:hypothetical protein
MTYSATDNGLHEICGRDQIKVISAKINFIQKWAWHIKYHATNNGLHGIGGRDQIKAISVKINSMLQWA